MKIIRNMKKYFGDDFDASRGYIHYDSLSKEWIIFDKELKKYVKLSDLEFNTLHGRYG